ncbi:surfeit locus protein 6-domain-containing protein [Cokeromyces recurvatus]|uniref:surfeit locus protein 6-domain-containing protein n=1 Tax=Cokeromyces recurvatus TaxID=90255 RepID=UPI00221E7C63|nr:surfeit locus protein 6-domain-containing protein [Cokeromyces recurvatus]KAI7905439.1 surfeit locus protein 6-domain-containing protein [Cokeromyces recurvatus]
MVQNHVIDSLSDRLMRDAQIFDDLLKLIPAKFYVMDKNDETNNKFQHNKRKKAPKQAIKDASKKAKKAKLDPDNAKSIVEVQQEKAKQLIEKEMNESESDSENEASTNNDNESEKMDVDTNAFSGLVDNESVKSESTTTASSTKEPAIVQPMEKSDITQLRNRLHERINELRKKRNAPGSNTAKPRSREDILAARNKKKEDRKKAIKAQKEKGGKSTSEELVKLDVKKPTSDKLRPSADSIKMDGDVYFGKLAIGNEQKKKKGPSDAKTQLKMLEAKKEKIEKLKEGDKAKANEMVEKEEWNRVLALATGEKIKDDAKLLKKTIKRQEKAKNKSGQEWKKRLDKVKQDEMKKIKKREENIKVKIEDKKNRKKGIKAKASNKARPGFEGGKRSKGGKVTKRGPPNIKGKK